jgi:hypothetical protein
MPMIPKVSLPEGSKGKWSIQHFEIGPDTPGLVYYAVRGRSIPHGRYARLVCEGRDVVMSDTPSEMSDHLSFVHRASGNVLINGLGIGMALNAILQPGRDNPVEHVTVIELEQDVIDLVGPHYLKDPRVEIVHASAFDYQPPKGVRYDAVWHDIWDYICSDNVEEMKMLHRRYGRRAEWQGSWCRWQCEQQLRRYA